MALISKKTVTIAGIAGLVVVALGGGYVVGSPIYSSWSENQASIVDSQAMVDQANAQLSSLRQAEAIYPDVLAGNEALEARFPTVADTAAIVDEIHEAALSAGIPESGVSSIGITPPAVAEIPAPAAPVAETPPADGAAADPAADPAAEAPADPAAAPAADAGVVDPASLAGTGSGSGFASFDLSITVNGTDAQIADFLTALNQLPRITLIDQFSIGQSSGGEGGTEIAKSVSFVAHVFVYEEVLSVEEQLAQPADEVADPATEEDGAALLPEPPTP